jgi:four helix bundle protein
MLENNKSIMNRRRHNYKNLKIWLLAMEIVNDVFELLADFPSDERFGLKSQISRCSISIPSNIAEGSARTEKSFSHFIDVSLGSSFELETQLLIALKRNYIKKDKFEELESKLMEFQKMTIGFQKTL